MARSLHNLRGGTCPRCGASLEIGPREGCRACNWTSALSLNAPLVVRRNSLTERRSVPRAWKVVVWLQCAQAIILLKGGIISIVVAGSFLDRYASADDKLRVFLALYALLLLTMRMLGIFAVVTACIVGIAAAGLMLGRSWGYWFTQAILGCNGGLGLIVLVNALMTGRLGLIVVLPLLQVVYSVGVMVILHRAYCSVRFSVLHGAA